MNQVRYLMLTLLLLLLRLLYFCIFHLILVPVMVLVLNLFYSSHGTNSCPRADVAFFFFVAVGVGFRPCCY